MKPLVAIVGRPNVGKSTLFNRLAGRRLALVEDVPGVTRDRHYAEAEWDGRAFTLIDTGGFLPDETDSLLSAVRQQAQLAVEESDAIIFVVDGRAGLTAADEAVAEHLRRSHKPVVVAVNKIDSPVQETRTYYTEFFRLGFEDTLSISAEHDLGVGELMERLSKHLPALGTPATEAEQGPLDSQDARPGEPVRVAIVGRPNVGKSTLINALLGEERLVASPVPGTTTDPIDSDLEWNGRRIVLTDTAGIRRKKNIAQKLEQYSVVAALKAIERSHVAVLVLDALEPAVDQDERIAGIAEEKGRALILVVNKWDLVEKKPGSEEEGRAWVKQRFRFAAYAPVVFASAKTGARVQKVLELSAQLRDQLSLRVPTPQLNRLLESLQESHPAPMAKGRPIRLYYIAQVASEPPTFALTCNQPEMVPADYKRYLVNQIRSAFDFRVPIRLLFRERPGQAKRAARKRPDKLPRRKRR
ncbi:MAG TPA: ribosome biogenesis GTPase Der [Myxococcaceae bacterium]|nr:ribosome biogenesis GTPase Der [Myxococcaceae bacterium]